MFKTDLLLIKNTKIPNNRFEKYNTKCKIHMEYINFALHFGSSYNVPLAKSIIRNANIKNDKSNGKP